MPFGALKHGKVESLLAVNVVWVEMKPMPFGALKQGLQLVAIRSAVLSRGEGC